MFLSQLTSNDIALIDYLRQGNISSDSTCKMDPASYMPTNQWLQHWNEEKRNYFAEPFKDSLIIQKKIHIDMSLDSLANEINQELENDCDLYDLYVHLRTKVGDYFVLNTIDPFFGDLNLMKRDRLYLRMINALFDVRSWAMNRPQWNENDLTPLEFHFADNTVIKITSDCKVMKTLGKICKKLGYNEEFEKLRLFQSRLTNEKNLNTDLYLSIHPLDYLTASYNNNNWTSCMNWEHGCYRRGVIEMMNSTYVVVAYTASSRPIHFANGLTWNSKKWRQFFIVCNQGIFAIKGYPYWNEDLEAATLHWMRELYAPMFKDRIGAPLEDHISQGDSTDNGLAFSRTAADNLTNAWYIRFCTNTMYNDLNCGYEHRAILAELNDNEKEEECWSSYYNCAEINYSGLDSCAWCGQPSNSGYGFTDEGSIYCEGCDPTIYCTRCGERIEAGDVIYDDDDNPYCSACWNEMPRCDLCGGVIVPFDSAVNDVGFFYMGPDNKLDPSNIIKEDMPQWMADLGYQSQDRVCHICNCCLDDNLLKEEYASVEPYMHASRRWFRQPYYPVHMLTDHAREILNIPKVKPLSIEPRTDEHLNEVCDF